MAKTYKQIMDEARQLVPEVSPEQVKARLDTGERPVVLDVREKEEVRQGYVPGAISLPRGFLEMRVEEAVPDKNAPIVAYCAGGTRSLLAGRILKELGYANVVSMRGGFTAWKNQGLPVKEDRQFTAEQQIRYSRHFLLPEVGEAGQAKLLGAKVLCIGAGGLGSPAAFYLAAAGVGTLGIVDMDVVDLSNLQRQILHTNDRIGMPKTESARLTLEALNPDVKALEAIKLILGQGTPLIGRMMHFETLSGEVRMLRLRRDPKCAVCGERPTVTKLIDYEMFCGLGSGNGAGPDGGHQPEAPEPAAAP